MKRPFSLLFGVLSLMLLLAACAQSQPPSSQVQRSPAASPTSPPTVIPTATSTVSPIPQGKVYTDAKLGFEITTPPDWQALPEPGSQASIGNAAVTFTTDEASTRSVIVIGVFHGASMPAAFAAQGTPTMRLGPYPAIVADRKVGEGRAPCLIRIFLAREDYVLADWCAPDAFSHRAQFEEVLATYQPAALTLGPQTTAAPPPQNCANMQSQLGYTQVAWGKQLATPDADGWRDVQPGVFVCSNLGSSDWYLFQCTELVNRFLYERWALPHLPGNAARYYDYYQDGVLHPGTIHEFPAGSYQLSDDASQGKSSFRPVAGDILVFQDVNNPRIGWTSGLNTAPGHVAVIVAVDDTSVYIAQENYDDGLYFMTLPLHQVANGYEITNTTFLANSLIRGWIHFTANGGPLPTL